MRKNQVLLLSTVASLAYTASAFAQDRPLAQAAPEQPATAEPVSDEGAASDVIVVTGTNIKGVSPTGASTSVITRADIEASGQSRISDLLRQLPQVQNNSSMQDTPLQDPPSSNGLTGGGFFFTNPTSGSATDLRGLGPAATLVLVDGRRQLATGVTNSFVEANRVPLAALERIEIISDGASAIYGSDAVAGVINYITRKNYQGLELSGRHSTNKSYDQWGIAATAGAKWTLGGQSGNIIVSYDFDRRQRMTYADNVRTRSDQTAFGGNDAINYIEAGVPAPTGPGYYFFQACPANSFFLAAFGACLDNSNFSNRGTPAFNFSNIPAGTTTSPTTGTFSTALPSNIQPLDAFRDFLPKTTRHSLNVYLNQNLSDGLSIYYQGTGSLRLTQSRSYNFQAVSVLTGNPFFPTAVSQNADPAIASVTEVSVPLPGILRTRTIRDEQYSNTIGFRADLPSEWEGEAYATLANAKQDPGDSAASAKQPNLAALNRLIALGQYNPFLGQEPSGAVINQTTGATKGSDQGKSRGWDFVLKFNGPLFTIGGGQVKAAVGGEYIRLRNDYLKTDFNAVCPTTTPLQPCTLAYTIDPVRSGSARRSVTAAFAEIFIPVVGPANARPFLRKLDIDVAVRAEDYSDVGSTVNPRVGIAWGLADGFLLRGSWGKAFRAPNLIELSASSLPVFIAGGATNNTGNPAYGPAGPATTDYLLIGGANPDLKPEKATNWSVGFEFEPSAALKGLSVSGTYYNIRYKDKIVALPIGLFLSNQANGVIYAPYLIPITSPIPAPGCDPLIPATYPGQIKAVLTTPPAFSVGSICNTRLILDARWQNAASVKQDGLDFRVDYRWNWENLGGFNIGASMTKILNLKEQLVAGVQTTPDPIDRIFNPLSFRARGNVGFSRGPFSANLSVNYTPGYTNDVGFIQQLPLPGGRLPATGPVEIESWTTADLNLSYDIRKNGDGGLLGGLRLSLNVQNVTNASPPIVLTGASFNTSYDARAHNPYGRTFMFQITKAI